MSGGGGARGVGEDGGSAEGDAGVDDAGSCAGSGERGARGVGEDGGSAEGDAGVDDAGSCAGSGERGGGDCRDGCTALTHASAMPV